ncbi:MAG: hypothetical protein ABL957_10380 [Parvularculaceae bacterium]
MSGIGYYTRLAAAVFVAAALGAAIANPQVGRRTAERSALAKIDRLTAEERACAPGEAPLTAGFAEIDDVLSVTPLSAVTAAGEAPPAPYLRLTGKPKGGRAAPIAALAPGKGEIVAIERRKERTGAGERDVWSVRLKPCRKITVFYDGLENIEPALMRRAGGLEAFENLDEGRSAVAVRLKLDAGDPIGAARAFDVGLSDLDAPVVQHAHASFNRGVLSAAAPAGASPLLTRALSFDESRARCIIDYLPAEIGGPWASKLGDASGVRRPKGDSACLVRRSAPSSAAGGDWFTDSSHNGRTNKVSAIALSDDLIDPGLLIFSLHGRLASLTLEVFGGERESAFKGVLTAPAGDGRLNAPFDEIKANETYCYEGVRAGFGGPELNGVMLLRLEGAEGASGLLKIEARGETRDCLDLDEPWRFSGNETSFYR